MSVQENLTIAKSMYNLFNERKFDLASKNVSDNVILFNIPQNIQLHGKEGFLQFMNFWTGAFPDSNVEINNMVANNDYVVTEFTGKGTHNGDLHTPMGIIPPTGKKIDFPFCEIFHFEDGKITRSHLYFDLATMMNQLELIPGKV